VRNAAARLVGVRYHRIPAIAFSSSTRVATQQSLLRLLPGLRSIGKTTILVGGVTGFQYTVESIVKACEGKKIGDYTDEQLSDIITSAVTNQVAAMMRKQEEDELRSQKEILERVELFNKAQEMDMLAKEELIKAMRKAKEEAPIVWKDEEKEEKRLKFQKERAEWHRELQVMKDKDMEDDRREMEQNREKRKKQEANRIRDEEDADKFERAEIEYANRIKQGSKDGECKGWGCQNDDPKTLAQNAKVVKTKELSGLEIGLIISSILVGIGLLVSTVSCLIRKKLQIQGYFP
jgi:hypothetical protein